MGMEFMKINMLINFHKFPVCFNYIMSLLLFCLFNLRDKDNDGDWVDLKGGIQSCQTTLGTISLSLICFFWNHVKHIYMLVIILYIFNFFIHPKIFLDARIS